MAELFKFKDDAHSKKRGGYSTLLEIYCAECSTFLFYYQKDGDGDLFRCYLNRILGPEPFSLLQQDPQIKEISDMPMLTCPTCNTCIGSPMRHSDNRLAFNMNANQFVQKINTNE